MKQQIIASKIKPQYIAQKCPVCSGWGTVSFKRITCHACGGKGFILIPADDDRQKEYEEKFR
jgi:DnaJ-class molecular chaperone